MRTGAGNDTDCWANSVWHGVERGIMKSGRAVNWRAAATV